MKKSIVLFIFPLLIFIFYANIWYLGDDFEHLYVFSLPIKEILSNVLTGNCYLQHGDAHFRPLNQFLLALNLKTGNPYFSHFLSLFIHYVNGLLVFVLLKRFFTSTISLFGFYFFLFNPTVNTTIFWISALNDVLVTLFSLLAFICFLKYLNEKKTAILSASVVLFFWCALLCKEMAVTLPLILTLIAYKTMNFRHSRNLLVYLWVSLVLFICIRTAILGHLLMGSADGHYFNIGKNTLLTVLKYVYCFMIPTPIFMNRNYPVAHLSIIPLVALFLTFAKRFWLKNDLMKPVFYISLLIISLLPVINSFSTWYMYYPSVIFSFTICYMLAIVKFSGKQIVMILYCIVSIVIMSYWANLYNKAGNFNKIILEKINQFNQNSFLFVNLPVAAYSNIPLITHERYMKEAIKVFHKKEVTVEYVASRMVNALPDKLNFRSITDTVFDLRCDSKYHDYFLLKNQSNETTALKNIEIKGTDAYNNITDITVYLKSGFNVIMVEPQQQIHNR